MSKVEKLRERYLQTYCELGYEHPDTQQARKEYFEAKNKEDEFNRNCERYRAMRKATANLSEREQMKAISNFRAGRWKEVKE